MSIPGNIRPLDQVRMDVKAFISTLPKEDIESLKMGIFTIETVNKLIFFKINHEESLNVLQESIENKSGKLQAYERQLSQMSPTEQKTEGRVLTMLLKINPEKIRQEQYKKALGEIKDSIQSEFEGVSESGGLQETRSTKEQVATAIAEKKIPKSVVRIKTKESELPPLSSEGTIIRSLFTQHKDSIINLKNALYFSPECRVAFNTMLETEYPNGVTKPNALILDFLVEEGEYVDQFLAPVVPDSCSIM